MFTNLVMLALVSGAVAVDPLVHVGSLTESLEAPARVAVAADGTVLVADPTLGHIARFDSAGALLGTWPVAEGPLDIAAHPDGRYFVSLRDTSQVAIYDAAFARIGTLGEGDPLVTFVRPTDIDIATDTGRIYVVDGEGDRVYGFESDGTLGVLFGIRGTGNGQFQHPSAIAVDEIRSRLIVADHDNFRIQTFTTGGVFQNRFGHRIKFTVGGDEGWMPRTLGVEVDSEGRVYVTDAMMGTVRIFDAAGGELGKVVNYGSAPGDVRTPCDVALTADGSRVYVVSTNTASVEFYDAPTFATPMPVQSSNGKEAREVVAIDRGRDDSVMDIIHRRQIKNRTNRKQSSRPQSVRSLFESATSVALGGASPAEASEFEGPHMIDGPVICGRCHGITGQPGGHVGLVEGQTVLCMSCHNTAGQGLDLPKNELDVADPYGTNPQAVDGQGRSHAWGVPAVNVAADSVGPLPGSEMERYLDGGQIKCSTCHNQHSNQLGSPYLRVSNAGDAMCKQCHAPRDEGLGERGTHPVGFAYPAGVGEFPLEASVSPLVIKAGKVECMTCHAPHKADSGGANNGLGDGMLLRASNDESLCTTCHTGHIGHTPSGAWQPTCEDCHDVHDPTNMNLSLVGATIRNQTLGLDFPVVFTAQAGPNSFDDGDPASNDGICQVCHTATTYHTQDGTGVSHNDGTNCTACHPHSAGFMPAGGSSCIACHSSPQDNGDGIPVGGRPAIVNADGSGGHHLAGGVLSDGDCTTCHEMSQHQAGNVRLWSDPNNPVTPLPLTGDPAELVPFCSACHSGVDHPIIHTTGAAWEPVCTQCHELHDPANTNLFLVNDIVRNQTLSIDKPVIFTALTGPNSFDDGDPAQNDGICQVCHTTTNYHLSDGTGTPHNDGLDCTTCHPHADGFLPTGGSCITCHSVPQNNGDGIPLGGRPAVVNADGSGGHHLAGAVMTEADCNTCHEMTQHQLGTVRLWADPNNPVAALPLTGNPAEVEGFCGSCHTGADHPTIHTTGAAWEPTCLQCHELHDPPNTNLFLVNDIVRNETLSTDKPVIFTALTGSNSFDDGDPTQNDGICQVCHTATNFHLQDGTGTPHNDGEDCTTCHPHGTGFLPTAAPSCIACHSTPQNNGDGIPLGGRPAVVNADGSGGHHLAGAVMTEADCITCHEMTQHQLGTVRLWSDPNNPVAALPLTGDPTELVPFCTACHSGVDHPIIHTTGAAWEPVCTQCHELHDPANNNLFLVNDIVRNETLSLDKPVIFTALTGPNSFDDGDPAQNDGICQVCHTVTNYHLQDGTGVPHNDGLDCTTCHPHKDGFLPTAGSCQDCHQTAQGARRPIVPEFGLASHHVMGALDDADCEVCHDMSQHQQGQVRLKNADDPTNPAAVVALAGDPTVDAVEAAKLDTFCLACHDADAAGGAAPFTDGVMPPAIDNAGWLLSSHRTSPMSCYGNGETFGCHSSGHGSAKRKLLAPADASQTPVAGDALREEEGMCYTCHDADGPASSDVQSAFGLATHHNVSSLEQVDGSKVECTDCHNPHLANAANHLADPDNGSLTAWTGTQAEFCVVCHDGTPPAGVTFPAGSAGTGYDKSAFAGTTHATELGPESCTHCHEQHGSQYISILRRKYVIADNNQWTEGDGDYAACWLCHDENETILQDNAFRNRHDKHVKGEDAPCMICHDVHAGADPAEPGLINFDFPVQNGYDIQYNNGFDASNSFWINSGQNPPNGRGYCNIECHGENHTPKDYDRSPNPVVDCTVCHP